MVAVVRGCNAPLLIRTITEQLAYEHKVLDGQAERKEVRRLFFLFLTQHGQLLCRIFIRLPVFRLKTTIFGTNRKWRMKTTKKEVTTLINAS